MMMTTIEPAENGSTLFGSSPSGRILVAPLLYCQARVQNASVQREFFFEAIFISYGSRPSTHRLVELLHPTIQKMGGSRAVE